MYRIKAKFNRLIFIAIFFASCGATDMEAFQEQAAMFAQKDHQISQGNFDSLMRMVQFSKDGSLRPFLTDKKPDCQKVAKYLVDFFTKTHVDFEGIEVWQPCKIASARFNVNVFVDNSKSMDGYFHDNAAFKTTLFNLFTDLKSLSEVSNLNLNFLNSEPEPIVQTADRDGIKKFCEDMDPARMPTAKGSNRANTDVATMLQRALDVSGPGNVSVFVSDCVFSPGKATKATIQMSMQQSNIYNGFRWATKSHRELAVLLLQCDSRFEGKYFDLNDNPHQVDMDRPYYIWFIGDCPEVGDLIRSQVISQIRQGVSHKLVLQSLHGPFHAPYKILQKYKMGDFQLENGAAGPITDAKPADGQHFGFEMAVDLRQSLQDKDYFLDIGLFHLSSPYSVTIQCIPDPPDITLVGFSHLLRLETTHLKEEDLEIDIQSRFPDWVSACSSSDDTRMGQDRREAGKTFGLKDLIQGVYFSFYPNSDSAKISTLHVDIKR